jgi:hypothetical protein
MKRKKHPDNLVRTRLFKIIDKPTKDKDGNPITYSAGNWFRPVTIVGYPNN